MRQIRREFFTRPLFYLFIIVFVSVALLVFFDGLRYNKGVCEKNSNGKEEERLYALFCQCVRYMEEEGDTGYWGILFNSTSFSKSNNL